MEMSKKKDIRKRRRITEDCFAKSRKLREAFISDVANDSGFDDHSSDSVISVEDTWSPRTLQNKPSEYGEKNLNITVKGLKDNVSETDDSALSDESEDNYPKPTNLIKNNCFKVPMKAKSRRSGTIHFMKRKKFQVKRLLTRIDTQHCGGYLKKCPSFDGMRKKMVLDDTSPRQSSLKTCSKSTDGVVELEILKQPEKQHRARYLTEGSRGSVKDRSGDGYPTIQLKGYFKPAKLQVFIGTDQGPVVPHMFYQACKVSGKSCTPCTETKINGTVVMEINFDPEKQMTISCDCVGILKERNVDVEHRFPDFSFTNVRKKSVHCRIVFQVRIERNGYEELLQVVSDPILCTQPSGFPEITRRSCFTSPISGGDSMFIIGKNFQKDSQVVFQQLDNDGNPVWEVKSLPDKEVFHQTHLVCPVPAYTGPCLSGSVETYFYVLSSNKMSEKLLLTYYNNAGVPNSGNYPAPQPNEFPSSIVQVSGGFDPRKEVDFARPPPNPSLSSSLKHNENEISHLLKQQLPEPILWNDSLAPICSDSESANIEWSQGGMVPDLCSSKHSGWSSLVLSNQNTADRDTMAENRDPAMYSLKWNMSSNPEDMKPMIENTNFNYLGQYPSIASNEPSNFMNPPSGMETGPVSSTPLLEYQPKTFTMPLGQQQLPSPLDNVYISDMHSSKIAADIRSYSDQTKSTSGMEATIKSLYCAIHELSGSPDMIEQLNVAHVQ